MEWLLAILGLVAVVANVVTTAKSNREQREHDEAMLQKQTDAEKELIDYEVSTQQNNNTIATQSGHAASAGFSPALLYGSSLPALSSGSGTAQGTASKLNPLQLFDRISPRDATEPILQQRYQEMQRARMASQNARDTSEIALNNARTMEQIRDTHQRKNLERVVYDQAMASLELTRSNRANIDFLTQRGNALLPGELVAQGLINQETEAKINKVYSDITRNSWEVSRIQHDIKRIDSAVSLNQSQTSLNYAEASGIQESTRKSAIGRIMQEFGLTSRRIPVGLRDKNGISDALNQGLHGEQMKGALIELINLGFSEREATQAVLYYVAEDPRDVTPSLVNGATRVVSSLILKK